MKHNTKWDIGNTALGLIRTLPLRTLMVNDLNRERSSLPRLPTYTAIWNSRADAFSILVGSF